MFISYEGTSVIWRLNVNYKILTRNFTAAFIQTELRSYSRENRVQSDTVFKFIRIISLKFVDNKITNTIQSLRIIIIFQAYAWTRWSCVLLR